MKVKTHLEWGNWMVGFGIPSKPVREMLGTCLVLVMGPLVVYIEK